MKRCPNCEVEVTNKVSCNCGYDFKSGEVRKAASSVDNVKVCHSKRYPKKTLVICLIAAVVIGLFWRKILLLVIIVSLFIMQLIGGAQSRVQDYREVYNYESKVYIKPFRIRVGLRHSHPFLAEYKRHIYIDDNKRIDFGIDPGGYSYINVYYLKDKIILQSYWPKILLLDKKTKSYTLETRALSEEEMGAFVGKFHFKEPGLYHFSTKKEDPSFSSLVMRGG